MKELVPACPRCNTSKFVVRDRIAEKAGTIVGGAVGAGGAYAGLSSGATAGAAIGSFIPILGTAVGAGIGALTGTLLGLVIVFMLLRTVLSPFSLCLWKKRKPRVQFLSTSVTLIP